VCALAVGGLSWPVSDRIEQRNDFCNACHLPDGTPLHIQVREDFDRATPTSLAGVHGRGWVEADGEGRAVRCIDCHSGAGPSERTRVKLLAARDAARYAIGSLEEPDGMPFPLSEQTCRACHTGFRHSAAPGWTVDAYHGLEVHDALGGPPCVSCHAVHERGGDGMAYYMDRARVASACRACHSDSDAPGISPELSYPAAD
jgi:hypothetical protein